MKNLKFYLIATLLSFALLSYADNGPGNSKRIIKVTLSQARTVPGMTAAMYAQLNPSFLNFEQPGQYSAVVRLNHKVYLVIASRKAWLTFFRTKPVGTTTSVHQ